MLTTLEWMGCTLGLLGAFLLATNSRVSKYGWLAFSGANLAMIGLAIGIDRNGFLLQQVGFLATSCLGIYRASWKAAEKERERENPFDRIDRLVTKEDFCLQAWNDRYSKGVWAALGLGEAQVDVVRNLSSAGDLDMIPAMDYVMSAHWLPYVTGETLAEAMQKLEDRLARLPQAQLARQSQWAALVSDAITALSDATEGRSWYDSEKPEPLNNLPATFDAAVVRLTATAE